MKRIFLTLSICALISSGAFAQLSGGVKLGLNSSNVKYSGGGFSISADPKIGFHVGGYLNAPLSEKVFIQPELLYSGMGAKSGDESINLNYISLPVMLGFNVGEVINLHLGPQLGFLMSAKSEDVDIKEGMSSIDFGAAFGVGANFGKFNAALRYYMGLSNIDDSEDSEGLELKNTAIQISVGYKLFGE